MDKLDKLVEALINLEEEALPKYYQDKKGKVAYAPRVRRFHVPLGGAFGGAVGGALKGGKGAAAGALIGAASGWATGTKLDKKLRAGLKKSGYKTVDKAKFTAATKKANLEANKIYDKEILKGTSKAEAAQKSVKHFSKKYHLGD